MNLLMAALCAATCFLFIIVIIESTGDHFGLGPSGPALGGAQRMVTTDFA